jgi:cell wall-associated NlpC family hydrolase
MRADGTDPGVSADGGDSRNGPSTADVQQEERSEEEGGGDGDDVQQEVRSEEEGGGGGAGNGDKKEKKEDKKEKEAPEGTRSDATEGAGGAGREKAPEGTREGASTEKDDDAPAVTPINDAILKAAQALGKDRGKDYSAKSAKFEHDEGYQGSHTGAGFGFPLDAESDKCNLFIAHVLEKAGFTGARNPNRTFTQKVLWWRKNYPWTANTWASGKVEGFVEVPAGKQQPGDVVAWQGQGRSGHVGIVVNQKEYISARREGVETKSMPPKARYFRPDPNFKPQDWSNRYKSVVTREGETKDSQK